jgi:hypothetical protein
MGGLQGARLSTNSHWQADLNGWNAEIPPAPVDQGKGYSLLTIELDKSGTQIFAPSKQIPTLPVPTVL